jgi:hypothetical protein
MTVGLKVSPKLTLPIDVAGESTAILAKKGAGKSNTAKVIVEETLDHGGVQVIVLDPIGHWWSLRAGANGKPGGGYPVAVFGGMHGDLPLEEHAGKLLAQTAVESGQSMVLDVSSLDSNGAMQRFVYEFLEELYKLKQATPTPVLLVLEEADEFAPQDPKGSNVPRMVGAANRISKRGRGRGIGMLYVTQRSAALNKNVLDQSDTLIVMRTIGPRDRKAIEGWVQHADAEGSELVLPSLPSLETGEAWIWTPERDLLQRVKIRKARTFDSSATPKPGEAAIVANVKPIDVAKLGQAIAATVERVKENDPAELRKRIAALQREAAKPAVAVDGAEVESLREQLRNADAVAAELDQELHEANEKLAEAAGYEQSHKILCTLLDELHDLKERGLSAMLKRSATLPAPTRPRLPNKPTPIAAVPLAPVTAASPPPVEEPSTRVTSGTRTVDGDLPLGAAKLLTVLAQFPAGRTRKQLAVLSGYKASGSTFRGAIAELRKRGYASPAGEEPIVATPEGLAAAPTDALPTGRALYEHWRRELPEGARKVLDVLYSAWPNGVARDEIAERVGYEAKGSTFRGALAALRNVDLITRAGVEPIKASDELMDTAA